MDHSTVCYKYTHTSSYRKAWILKGNNQAAAQCNLERTSNQSIYYWTCDLPSSSLYYNTPASSLHVAGNMQYFMHNLLFPFSQLRAWVEQQGSWFRSTRQVKMTSLPIPASPPLPLPRLQLDDLQRIEDGGWVVSNGRNQGFQSSNILY